MEERYSESQPYMAAIEELRCVNHPGEETRVRCSSCNSPICVKCMRESAVGMKCPSCASRPLRTRIGKPKHYLLAVAGGFVTSAAIGVALLFIPFIGIFGGLLTGLAVGEVVRRASGRSGLRIFQWLAVLTAVAGLAAVTSIVLDPSLLLTPGWLLRAGLTAMFAWLRSGS